MREFSDLVPDEFYSDLLPTSNKEEFLYLGRENLCLFSDSWKKLADRLSKQGKENDDFTERLSLISEAQACRKRANKLAELASGAESKPIIFRKEPYCVGQHITCFVQQPARKLPRGLSRPNRFIDAVVLQAKRKETQVVYSLSIRNCHFKDNDPKKYRFISDNTSAILTDDFHYLRAHPNYFQLYLSLRATNANERDKIESILSALY